MLPFLDSYPWITSDCNKKVMKIQRTQYTFARLVSCYYKIDFNNTRLKHVTFVSVHTIDAADFVVVVVFVRVERILYIFSWKFKFTLFVLEQQWIQLEYGCVCVRESEKQKTLQMISYFFIFTLIVQIEETALCMNPKQQRSIKYASRMQFKWRQHTAKEKKCSHGSNFSHDYDVSFQSC